MFALVTGDGLRDFLGGEVRVMVGLQDVGDDRRCCGFSWGTWLIHTSSLFSESCSADRGGGANSRRLPGDGAIVCGSHCCR